MMIGTELKTVVRRDAGTTGTVRLAVDGLSVAAEALHGIDLKDISFDVRAGEVFGIAGVAGNGQNELLLALSGERVAGTAAALRIDGEAEIGRGSCRESVCQYGTNWVVAVALK